MPKRARCPHCDRLFDRNQLDKHIQNCRMKSNLTKNLQKRTTTHTVVVDGNNVAYHLSPEGQPHVSNLMIAHRTLIAKGLRPVFVVSAALMHAIDKPDALQSFITKVNAIEAPRGVNDDLKIIQTARERGADIISNDRFLDWIERYPWISDRLRRYRMTPTGLILT